MKKGMRQQRKTGDRGSRNRRKWYAAGIIIMVILVLLGLGLNWHVMRAGGAHIAGAVTDVQLTVLDPLLTFEADCILVLGAGLKEDGTPNYMLRDRLDVGIALYEQRTEADLHTKLLLSGDNGQEHYDEVNAMKRYVLDRGVPEEDIFLDHAGFSTYESMYRAKAIFDVGSAIVVTQGYHQPRALYLARGLGIEAVGISSDQQTYMGQTGREIREILARDKDFVKLLFKPKPTYLGDVIPISGSGLASQD